MWHRRYWWDLKFYHSNKGNVIVRIFDAKTDKILYLRFDTFLQIEDWLTKEKYNPCDTEEEDDD